MEDKKVTTLMLRGQSCHTCRYQLTKEKVRNYGRPHGFISGISTVTMESPVPHCALRTDIGGSFIARSELHDSTPCKNHWEKEKNSFSRF